MVTDREVTLSGGMVISYLDAGAPDGDVVFYFHGTPSSRMQAAGPVDAAAAQLGLRVIAPDRPGCGGSPFVRYRVADYPAIVVRFADSLGIGEFGVVGTSGGGRYALACASALADRLRRWRSSAARHPRTSQACGRPGANKTGGCTPSRPRRHGFSGRGWPRPPATSDGIPAGC